ncbi:MAG: IS1 family transposase, partial [Leptolyngbyaceae cyanobacterium]
HPTRQPWQSLPAVYRQYAKVNTEYWEADETVMPRKRHFAIGKESGLTSYRERLNNTIWQRISRLVRKTLSFSKKVENHIGVIWTFITSCYCLRPLLKSTTQKLIIND